MYVSQDGDTDVCLNLRGESGLNWHSRVALCLNIQFVLSILHDNPM